MHPDRGPSLPRVLLTVELSFRSGRTRRSLHGLRFSPRLTSRASLDVRGGSFQAKARKAIAVPLNDTAVRLVRAQKAKHPIRVFTYEGEPIRQVSTRAWYKALKRAGIEDFRWHDLRHTWASWHVQSGTPLFALQVLAGWETEKMVRRYAHLAAAHLMAYTGNMESHGTNTAQPPDFRGTA